jgi:hypothetical protein
MNPIEDNLALRKELLVARSSLCRLKIRHEVETFRHHLTWREAGAEAVRTPAARDALFLLAAEGIGRSRMARWLAVAAQVLAIAKLASLALQTLRTPPADPAGPAQP